ncbi:MAG: hypothetical protein IK011_01505, partial [Bacteroidaceae bacterium]|nr:hypothetical protein [Bacteroidaceae bacterium]
KIWLLAWKRVPLQADYYQPLDKRLRMSALRENKALFGCVLACAFGMKTLRARVDREACRRKKREKKKK